MDTPNTPEPYTPESRALQERERRRRAAELLGDLEPQMSRDETAEGWNEEGGTSREEQLVRDVPPHHSG